MKILYVEDELKKNISGIIQLFNKYLGEDIVLKLEELMNDVYSGDEEIKDVIEQCDFIEVAYSFPDAIKKVKLKPELFSLFIVDCNLSEQPYLVRDLREIAPEYDEDKENRYRGREGEYLLNILSANKQIEDLKDKFYFLSAYSASSNIISLIDNGTITKNNYIEKGSSEGNRFLKRKVIEKNKNLLVKLTNKPYIDVLEKIDSNLKSSFINLIINQNNETRIRENCQIIRMISEKIYTKVAKDNKVPSNIFVDRYPDQINIRPFIYWINNKRKFNANSIINNGMLAIQSICSDVIHGGIKGYQPTIDTVNYLVYALKDIILWYSQDKIKKK
ncbi:MAG: hypothetical protein WC155_03640 [Candidatus Cloacimonadales bacterium]